MTTVREYKKRVETLQEQLRDALDSKQATEIHLRNLQQRYDAMCITGDRIEAERNALKKIVKQLEENLPNPTQRVEYRVQSGWPRGPGCAMETMLNRYAKDGWRLVQVLNMWPNNQGANEIRSVFERDVGKSDV